jgi:predicted RNA polymerase sigma factor
MVSLNQAVAIAMVDGPSAGLARLDELAADARLAAGHRVEAVRGHLLEMAGDPTAARSSYLAAARKTTSVPERRYLESRAARIA